MVEFFIGRIRQLARYLYYILLENKEKYTSNTLSDESEKTEIKFNDKINCKDIKLNTIVEEDIYLYYLCMYIFI